MSDDEDDYLSDKFLLAAAPTPAQAAQTYSQKRHEAARRAEALRAANRTKSVRERELEAREEGLSRSLFERAEDGPGGAGENKALAMMMKMGFKPGQALGRREEEEEQVPVDREETAKEDPKEDDEDEDDEDEDSHAPGIGARSKTKTGHRTEPLPLGEWAGRKGIGLGKRKLSPARLSALAKASKHAEHQSVSSFRDTARAEYLLRRAAASLGAAQRTLRAQDEGAGVRWHALWVDPDAPESVPPGLLDALGDGEAAALGAGAVLRRRREEEVEARLRKAMRADALQPVKPLDALEEEGTDEDDDGKQPAGNVVSDEEVDAAREFLRCDAVERLARVLTYLRTKYSYCFWCGTEYASADELETSCPGEDEEDHD